MGIKKIISIIFLFIFFIPVLDKVLNISDKFFKYDSNEKRALTKMPELDTISLEAIPKACEEYVNDHFMGRNFMISQYNRMRVELFRQSPVPDKAYIGKDDWLYLNNYEYNVSHKVDLSDQQLKAFLDELTYRRDFLKQQNCSLYVYIVPSKIKVYPEYGVKNIPVDPNQGEQLETYIKKNSNLSISYLLPTFFKEKKKDAPLLFCKTDNHWSIYGAFIAYKKIIEDIKVNFTSLKPLTMNDLALSDRINNGGNIAQMIGAESYFKEYVHNMDVAKPHATDGQRKHYPFTGDFDKNQFEKQFDMEDKTQPSALFIGDSFSEALIPFLSENFSHTTFIFDIWKYQLNEEIVKREKPGMLVYIIYEPLLLKLLDNSQRN